MNRRAASSHWWLFDYLPSPKQGMKKTVRVLVRLRPGLGSAVAVNVQVTTSLSPPVACAAEYCVLRGGLIPVGEREVMTREVMALSPGFPG